MLSNIVYQIPSLEFHHQLNQQLYQNFSTQIGNERSIQSLNEVCFIQTREPIIANPKTIGEVLGERVVRPLLDNSSRSFYYIFNFIRKSLKSIDQVISNGLHFFPTADAQKMLQTKTNFNNPNPGGIVQYTWKAIDIDPKCYTNFVSRLSKEEKLELANDAVLQNNHLKLHKMVNEIARMIVQKTNKFLITGKMIQYCYSLKLIEETLNAILVDLKNKKADSEFFPTKKTHLCLSLPQFCYETQQIIKAGKFIKNQKEKFAITTDPNLLLKQCTTNPIQEVLFLELTSMNAILSVFNIEEDEEFNLEDFKKLFCDNVMENMEKHFEHLKTILESSTEQFERDSNIEYNTEAYLLTTFKIEESIRMKINEIYLEQKKFEVSHDLVFST